MYGALDIATSGLVAQRTRLDVITANIANANSIENADHEYEPYRRRYVEFAAGDPALGTPLGVHVADIGESDAPLEARFDPTHRYADADGYVYYPNVDPVVEQMNAMIALRAYEANVSAAEATKSMISVALQMIA